MLLSWGTRVQGNTCAHGAMAVVTGGCGRERHVRWSTVYVELHRTLSYAYVYMYVLIPGTCIVSQATH